MSAIEKATNNIVVWEKSHSFQVKMLSTLMSLLQFLSESRRGVSEFLTRV